MRAAATLLTASILTFAAEPVMASSQMFSGENRQCIIPAAKYHGVNANILWAILKVESNFRPGTVTTNENKTHDYGMGGMNSIHMPALSKHGVTREKIKDPCVSTYVTAWHLRKEIEKHGNSWFGVAAYHSATPYFNNRYQILLKNALVDAGVLNEPKQKVPPLKRNGEPKKSTAKVSTPDMGSSDQMLVADFSASP